MSELDDEQLGPGQQRPEPGLDAVARFQSSPAHGDQAATQDPRQLPDRLCRAAMDALAVDGAGISVYLGADIAVPVGAADPDVARAEGLQFTLHEGPCLQSYATHEAVLVPDIGRPGSQAWTNWPAYASELTRHTLFRAVFAYPLLFNGQAMGSLGLYRLAPGAPGDLKEITTITELISASLLRAEMFAGLDGEREHPWIDGPNSQRRKQVWAAQGLTMQANSLTPAQALDFLRAQAYTAERLLDDVAADIVAGRLPVPVLTANG